MIIRKLVGGGKSCRFTPAIYIITLVLAFVSANLIWASPTRSCNAPNRCVSSDTILVSSEGDTLVLCDTVSHSQQL